MTGWRTELSPFRVENAERRAGVAIRRAPNSRGFKLSPGVVAVRNDKRKAKASQRKMRQLLALLEGK